MPWVFWLILLIIGMAILPDPCCGQGLVQPKGWEYATQWDDRPAMTALPAHFDWREHVHFPEVRNQGRCGSCWSFGVTGVTELVHRAIFPMLWPVIDLSEQYLVSRCCGSGDCGGGYFSAFNCIKQDGLPLEKDLPYVARNSSCVEKAPYIKIDAWYYVGNFDRPSTAEIKQAIYDHGPVVVDVNGSLESTTGIMRNCNRRGTNHMVVLTGWHDDDSVSGGGYWFMRNSWGADWADNGYLKIPYKGSSGYNCNGVGNVTAYAIIAGVENLRQYLGIGEAVLE